MIRQDQTPFQSYPYTDPFPIYSHFRLDQEAHLALPRASSFFLQVSCPLFPPCLPWPFHGVFAPLTLSPRTTTRRRLPPVCSIAWQRRTPRHSLLREGLPSLDGPQRKLPSALAPRQERDRVGHRPSHNVKHDQVSLRLSPQVIEVRAPFNSPAPHHQPERAKLRGTTLTFDSFSSKSSEL